MLEDFLSDRKQRFVLNGQFRLGLIFALVYFLLYINELSNYIKSKCKLADDKSLFSLFLENHKYFGMILDSKLSHGNHLKSPLRRVNNTISLLRKL